MSEIDAFNETDLGSADDGLTMGTGGAAGATGTGAGGSAGSPGVGGDNGGAGAGGSGVGGASGGRDGGSGGAAGAGADGGVDAARPDAVAVDLSSDATTPPTSCGSAPAPTKIWSFATNVEGWDFADGAMIRTGAVGDPDVGALQVDWTGTAPVHPRRLQALGDLRGRVVTARVWVDPGAAVGIKVFVQTGVRYWWADGGQVTPPPGQWTCVTLDIDTPAFSRQQYDPTDVQVLGLELQTGSSGRVYIDQVEY